MSTLRTVPRDNSGVAQITSLEGLLDELQKFGLPRLHCFKDGNWCACVEMHIAAEGAKFEIKSDFKQATPRAAADQCLTRVREAVRKFGSASA